MSFNRTAVLLLLGITIAACTYAQPDSSSGDSVHSFRHISPKYLEKVSSKASSLGQKFDKHTEKALRQLKKQEDRIKRKLAKTDPARANAIFGNAREEYKKLEQRLSGPGSLQQYVPGLDTMASSLKFLQQNPSLLSAAGAQQKLSNAISNVNGLEGKLQKAEDIGKFLKERREYLRNQLSSLGFAKELKAINKQAYYYSAQLNEYKSLLKDRKKAEKKALELLSNTKMFKTFMRKNSMLASLFRLPGDDLLPTPSGGGGLAGLQTRAQVNGLIQQQVAAGGPNAQQQLRQNMQVAQAQINDLKQKLIKAGSGSSDEIMPEGFKPNTQRSKSFFKRLELGTNIQSQKANGYFPVTSDIGLSLGYRLNDNSIIGVGSSYKIGWGHNIRHINITHQGVGLRSFVDWKIRGSFWVFGGYEMNYRSEFDDVEQLRNLNAWQQSGMVGLSKVVSLKTKFFKKTKLQFLWDFLSYRQVPRTQPIVFRIGYSFN